MTTIPKIIHYCWISSDNWDSRTTNCFDSWKKYIPDYQYMLWNTETLPDEVLEIPTVQHAMKAQKWAFVADYVRIWALYNYGGIYMDLDVELLKSPTALQNTQLLFGMEKDQLGAHFIGSVKGHPFIKYILDKLALKSNFLPLPAFITQLYQEFYNQNVQVSQTSIVSIYPNDYFNPFYWDSEQRKGALTITDNTYCIHWYAGGWIPRYKKTNAYKLLRNMFDKSGILSLLRKIRGY